MNKTLMKRTYLVFALAMAFLILQAATAQAMIDGITGPSFALTAKEDFISTADGGTWLLWGYANGTDSTDRAQYPGPILIVNEGQTVTVTLNNELPVPVSIVFPGQGPVTATGGAAGLLTQEVPAAPAGGSVQYTFMAAKPGTYMYHSGTQPDLQVEMGLVGAIIVRPLLGAKYAYNHAGAQFDREYLFFLSEMDPIIHKWVEFFGPSSLEGTDLLSTYFPNYWFINGRTAVDTMLAPNPPGTGLFPTQPYDSMPMMRPGDRVLMRVVGAGRQIHPFHHHGNHAQVIAKDGRLLDTGTAAGWPDLSTAVFTIQSVPGQTADAIFEWTGKGMNWDIYGTGPGYEHNCIDLVDNKTGLPLPGDPANPYAPGDGYADLTSNHPWEWCADHGKPIPVTLPAFTDLTMGPFFSGSPYLGKVELLPPGQGGLNPMGAYIFMWHSHNEKELCNYGVFPGGLMTMMAIHPEVPIE